MEPLRGIAESGDGLSQALARALLGSVDAPPMTVAYRLKEVLPRSSIGTGLLSGGDVVLQYHPDAGKNAFFVEDLGSLVRRLCALFAQGEMDSAPPISRHVFYYFYEHPCIPAFDFDGKDVSLRVFKRGLFHYMHSELRTSWEHARRALDHVGVFHSVHDVGESTLDPADETRRPKMSCHVHCMLYGPLATGWAEHLSVARFVQDFVSQQAGEDAVLFSFVCVMCLRWGWTCRCTARGGRSGC